MKKYYSCSGESNHISCRAFGLSNSRTPKALAFTMAERLSRVAERHLHFGLLARGQGFTMAEILISLTIIGIIAAITLPSLRANINEKTWATQRKALYSRMSQALSMLPSLNGYGDYEGTWAENVATPTKDTAAASFVTDGLAKVLQINNICSVPMGSTAAAAREKLAKCGVSSKIQTMNKSKIYFPTKLSELNPMFTSTLSANDGTTYTNPQHNIDTVAAAFETKNGETLAVFYNKYCTPMDEQEDYIANVDYSQAHMCANFIYDLNGKKGPNIVGKDIGFITALYPVDPNIVAPIPLASNAKNGNSDTIAQTLAAAACRKKDNNSRLPNRDELAAMFYNKQLLNIWSDAFWSASVVTSSTAWLQVFGTGRRRAVYRSNAAYVRCIKR